MDSPVSLGSRHDTQQTCGTGRRWEQGAPFRGKERDREPLSRYHFGSVHPGGGQARSVLNVALVADIVHRAKEGGTHQLVPPSFIRTAVVRLERVMHFRAR